MPTVDWIIIVVATASAPLLHASTLRSHLASIPSGVASIPSGVEHPLPSTPGAGATLGVWLGANSCVGVRVRGRKSSCVYRSGWVHLGPEMSVKCFPKPCRMPPAHWKALRGREQGSGSQEEPAPPPPEPRSGWGKERQQRPQGRMGGSRKREEMERRKRKGRELSLRSLLLAPQESLWAGKEGSMSCPADRECAQRTPHPTSCCPNLLPARWAQAALATNVKCQSFGIWGSAIKAQLTKSPPLPKHSCPCPTPKTLPTMPYPTADFKLTPVSLLPAPLQAGAKPASPGN